MKSLLNKLKLAITVMIMGTTLLVPATALAQTKEDICKGVDFTGANDCISGGAGAETKVEGIVETVINILSLVVGVIAVIMIIVGGLKYITSSGDSNNVNSAKNTILYAIVGLVIVAMAQFIVRFVLGRVN
jgi:uncharacterized membrane protein